MKLRWRSLLRVLQRCRETKKFEKICIKVVVISLIFQHLPKQLL